MKKVAVVMESWQRYFTYAWTSGMLEKIKEIDADVNLYVFNSSANWSDDDAYNKGEYNIFRLPDLSEFDGVVLDLNNIKSVTIKDWVLKKAKAANVPTIVIGNQYEDFYSAEIDNYNAMQTMLTHLIEQHECNSFWFIMGPEENYENMQRTKAIQDCLKQSGNCDKEAQYYFGTFDHHCGAEGFEYLKNQNATLPDAIVCANDNIAVGVLDTAQKYGWSAPKDFLITGFDDLDKARYFMPRISTISYRREDVGYACMEMLLDIWAGKKIDKVFYTQATPIFWESCGCTSKIRIDERQCMKDNILAGLEMSDFQSYIVKLNYQLSHCNTVQEVLRCVSDSILSLNCDALYLVTDEQFTQIQDDIAIQPERTLDLLKSPFVTEGYPKNMTMAFSYENTVVLENQNVLEENNKKSYIHSIFPMFECNEKGVNFLFLPLHFKEQCVGYFVIRNAIYLMEKQFLFEIINSLTTALENLYTKGQLERMNYALSVLYNHDAMTMLYNRLGLEEYAQSLLKRVHGRGESLCIMYIDLDRLKYINDNLGHEMGDFAIKTVANTIKGYCSKEGLAFRLGGDEFLVLDSYETEDEIEYRCSHMQKELKQIGKEHNCPVELTISYGYVFTEPNKNISLDEYIQQADDIMYQYKVARKKNREV